MGLRKIKPIWRILLITLAILVFLVILIWPMAPLWQSMGLKPFCIQGSWPEIKITACPDQASIAVTPVPLPTPGSSSPIPIIVDDDGSPDGMMALLFFLQNPLFDVRAVTISYGEAHPQVFALQTAKMLASVGHADIPVGYGSDRPLEGENGFPDSWRQASDNFWDVSIPESANAQTPVLAPELIVKTVSESAQPVTLFVSGSHTNLAEALRLDSGITGNIREVFIMGGSVNLPGNIHSDYPEFENETAEWNIWVDPLAASEVFASGLKLHLVPLDATGDLSWSADDIQQWKKTGSPEGTLAAGLAQWMLDSWSVKYIYIWDLVAALHTANPGICPESQLDLDVVTAAGPDQGRTARVDQGADVFVCFEPDPEYFKGLAVSVFQQP